MNQIESKKPFNKRAFISTALFLSGFILPLSGFLNHYFQFDKLSFGRHLWMSIHNISGVLFVSFAILHLMSNWKALINYAKKAKKVYISQEALAAIAFVIIIVGLVSSHAFHVNN